MKETVLTSVLPVGQGLSFQEVEAISMILEPEANAIASAQLVVRQQDLASSISPDPQDAFPPVFATARMVALMETAAARIFHLLSGAKRRNFQIQ